VELVVVEAGLDTGRDNAVGKARNRRKHLPEHEGSISRAFEDSFKRGFVVASDDTGFLEVGLRVEVAEGDRRCREKTIRNSRP
jgi:hypothetical protein